MFLEEFEKKLEAAKRASTAHLLIKCGRLVNEHALGTLPSLEGGHQPRAAHMALFPHIDLERGARVTELAGKLGITKQAVGQLVDDLEEFGIVERVPDPGDGRAKLVCFTTQGKSAMLGGLAHLRSVDRVLGRALGRDALRTLHEALLVLNDHFSESG